MTISNKNYWDSPHFYKKIPKKGSQSLPYSLTQCGTKLWPVVQSRNEQANLQPTSNEGKGVGSLKTFAIPIAFLPPSSSLSNFSLIKWNSSTSQSWWFGCRWVFLSPPSHFTTRHRCWNHMASEANQIHYLSIWRFHNTLYLVQYAAHQKSSLQEPLHLQSHATQSATT